MLKRETVAIKLRKFNRICPITGYKEGSIRIGAPVIVQTDRGVEYGEIAAFPHGVPSAVVQDVKLKKVNRYATPQDVQRVQELPALEAAAKKIVLEKAREHELHPHIVDIEYLFDASRVIIYYKPEDKEKTKSVRDLSRDLAAALKARVELRQLSPRDEARLLGGLGPCGRPLCCSVWLGKPKHVTVKMAKEQGLAISPTKTAGMCGRLMCCLEYEYEGR